jgi:uncharacterized protein involved in tolerance to divalent cations
VGVFVIVRWKAALCGARWRLLPFTFLGLALADPRIATPLLAAATDPPPPAASPAPPPQRDSAPAPRRGLDPRPPRSAQSDGAEENIADPTIEDLLAALAEKATVYQSIALRFVCMEWNLNSDNPNDDKTYDYMYVEEEAQRYRPYRQRHSENPNQTSGEIEVENTFPDSYSWTLMFLRERQGLFRFEFVADEWFALRRAHVLAFTAPLPYSGGETIYEWGGKVWIDAENLNFLKIEAEPANQEERLKQMLREYRQAPRFLVFPMKSRPAGGRYSITFLNEYQRLSLPDGAEYQGFVLDLEGNAELTGFRSQRYGRYQFFGVEVRDRFLN